MISYGAVLGKVTPLQLLIMGIMEPMFYWLNVFINAFKIGALDIGKSL
jgi:ammonium transporter Rh